jgi:hypothetical protein
MEVKIRKLCARHARAIAPRILLHWMSIAVKHMAGGIAYRDDIASFRSAVNATGTIDGLSRVRRLDRA